MINFNISDDINNKFTKPVGTGSSHHQSPPKTNVESDQTMCLWETVIILCVAKAKSSRDHAIIASGGKVSTIFQFSLISYYPRFAAAPAVRIIGFL